jgi:hypothetical protein
MEQLRKLQARPAEPWMSEELYAMLRPPGARDRLGARPEPETESEIETETDTETVSEPEPTPLPAATTAPAAGSQPSSPPERDQEAATATADVPAACTRRPIEPPSPPALPVDAGSFEAALRFAFPEKPPVHGRRDRRELARARSAHRSCS